jgi:hypothetical protein
LEGWHLSKEKAPSKPSGVYFRDRTSLEGIESRKAVLPCSTVSFRGTAETREEGGGIMLKYEKKELKAVHGHQKRAMAYLDQGMERLLAGDSLEDWRRVRKRMAKTAERLCKEPGVPRKMGEVLAFAALEEAVEKEKAPLCRKLQRCVAFWWEGIDPRLAPLCHERAFVAFDMGQGFTEKEAQRNHRKWLDEDPENRIFEDWFYAPDGAVVYIVPVAGES